MNMKRDIFENNTCPFTVPDGYFDTLQERIMSRIRTEESRQEVQGRIVRMPLYRKIVAAAACVLFIFSAATLYVTHTDKQSAMDEMAMAIDEEFYRWFYAADRVSEIAESLDVVMPDCFMTSDTAFSEEDEAIIQYFERDNINVAAILYSIDNDMFLFH